MARLYSNENFPIQTSSAKWLVGGGCNAPNLLRLKFILGLLYPKDNSYLTRCQTSSW
jgi:hypothetical protein